MIYCPIRGMGEKPSPLGEGFSLKLEIEIKIGNPPTEVGGFYPMSYMNYHHLKVEVSLAAAKDEFIRPCEKAASIYRL